MRRFRQGADDSSLEEPLINLTPLIDVVFVVLITFILIAPAIQLDHVELAESGSAAVKNPTAASHIVIHVKADNTIWFQGKNVSDQQLKKALLQRKKENPKEIPQVIQDKKAAFGTYQTVKNTLEACGFEQMDIVLSPPR